MFMRKGQHRDFECGSAMILVIHEDCQQYIAKLQCQFNPPLEPFQNPRFSRRWTQSENKLLVCLLLHVNDILQIILLMCGSVCEKYGLINKYIHEIVIALHTAICAQFYCDTLKMDHAKKRHKHTQKDKSKTERCTQREDRKRRCVLECFYLLNGCIAIYAARANQSNTQYDFRARK